MKLTRRQQDFLEKFLDLYYEAKQPLHYTEIAHHLGVKPLTAYDMLRLLEERGLVKSEFVVKEGRGRSSVVFYPSRKAERLMAQLAGDAWEQGEWETVKAQILKALEEGKGSDYADLLEELVLRLFEPSTPMIYATRMIAAVLLALHQLKESRRKEILEHLKALGMSVRGDGTVRTVGPDHGLDPSGTHQPSCAQPAAQRGFQVSGLFGPAQRGKEAPTVRVH